MPKIKTPKKKIVQERFKKGQKSLKTKRQKKKRNKKREESKKAALPPLSWQVINSKFLNLM